MDSIVQFKKIFSKNPLLKVDAPGRVNLIGEHTDYNDGYVMPIAIQYTVTLFAGPRPDDKVYIHSVDFGKTVSFSLREPLVRDPNAQWSDYGKGVIDQFIKLGYPLQGMDLLFFGNVPIGSGLSSSAAVEVAFATAIRALEKIPLSDIELIQLCQKAENEFVGMKCGIMDQFISCLGKEGHALFLDCRTLDYELVPFPNHMFDVVILNTKKKRELHTSDYNERRKQCEEGVRLLQKFLPQIKALRDIDVDTFQKHAHSLPEIISKRCQHVIEENQRVKDFVRALKEKDTIALEELLIQSHESLRTLYEVSCKELDLMVKIAMDTEGILGARMTGAGFGGCAIALVKKGNEEKLRQNVLDRYPAETGIQPEVYISTPSQGARVQWLE